MTCSLKQRYVSTAACIAKGSTIEPGLGNQIGLLEQVVSEDCMSTACTHTG